MVIGGPLLVIWSKSARGHQQDAGRIPGLAYRIATKTCYPSDDQRPSLAALVGAVVMPIVALSICNKISARKLRELYFKTVCFGKT